MGIFYGLVLLNEGPTINHLLLADDILFLGQWSISNVENIARLMRCFYLILGLKMNVAKSSFIESSTAQTKSTIACPATL